eukprot:950172-Rhodomonas_salina.1
MTRLFSGAETFEKNSKAETTLFPYAVTRRCPVLTWVMACTDICYAALSGTDTGYAATSGTDIDHAAMSVLALAERQNPQVV